MMVFAEDLLLELKTDALLMAVSTTKIHNKHWWKADVKKHLGNMQKFTKPELRTFNYVMTWFSIVRIPSIWANLP